MTKVIGRKDVEGKGVIIISQFNIKRGLIIQSWKLRPICDLWFCGCKIGGRIK